MHEKILLTGGSGFIGSEVVRLAAKRGFEVLNLDIKPPHDEAQRCFWREVDVRDAPSVEREMSAFAPDRVLHLASDIDITISSLNQFTTITDGTRNVLAAIAKLPEIKRFIHTSTQFTVRPGVEPSDERFLKPYTLYGEAKAISEKMVWDVSPKTRWFIVRPTIIWGPHHPTFAREIFRRIYQGVYLHPTAPQPIMRAFGYVTNVAEQMMNLATIDANATQGHVLYLGDETINYDQWADAFAIGLTGKPAKRIPVWLLGLLGNAGDLVKAAGLRAPIDSGRAFRMSTSSRIDLTSTHAITGPSPVSFEQGVKETLLWLEEVYSNRSVQTA